MLVWITSTEARFGRMWRPTIRPVGAPRARLASTNSRSLSASTGPRTTRAKIGVYTTAMARTTLAGCGPSAATIPSARRTAGKEKKTSIKRMSAWSVRPPAQPARSPSAAPTTSAASTEEKATSRDSRAPWTSRDRRSRPNTSAPSGSAQLGPAIRSWGTIRSGLGRGSWSAAAPTARNVPTMRSPARAARFRTNGVRLWRLSISRRTGVGELAGRQSLPPSIQADPGVEPAVEDIDERVGGDEEDGDDEHRPLDQRVVALVDGCQEHPAEARHREDLLDHHGAAQEVADLDAQDRHDNDQAVPERVVADDRRRREPLGVRGPDVVGAQHVEHRGARRPHDHRGHRHPQRHRGEEEEPEVRPRVLGEADVTSGVRHPPEVARQQEHEEGTQPEVG